MSPTPVPTHIVFQIADLLVEGKTYQRIGAVLGMSRQRVQQIAAKRLTFVPHGRQRRGAASDAEPSLSPATSRNWIVEFISPVENKYAARHSQKTWRWFPINSRRYHLPTAMHKILEHKDAFGELQLHYRLRNVISGDVVPDSFFFPKDKKAKPSSTTKETAPPSTSRSR